jgi:hypothetical protein
MDSITLQQELEKCIREIQDIQQSGASRSHAGPTLALRALMNKYRRLKEKLDNLNEKE